MYKALLFTLCVMLFDIIEIYIKALIYGQGFVDSFHELQGHLNYIWLGSAMLIFFIFIPFFAFKELSRVMGIEKIKSLFLRSRENG